MSEYGLKVFDHHARLLTESAVSVEVATERGYESVTAEKRIASYGFTNKQRKLPGLLIPVHDVSGAVATYQYRPDNPRATAAGKVVKYETPSKSRMVLDVPPRVRGQLADPAVDLWITEGSRKADSAVSAGLCCIALLGVWNWRGSNGQGGKAALADWESVALNGRRVYVAFDSDVMTKRSVFGALDRLGAFLASRGADPRFCYLPDDGDGKVGLDDYLAAGGSADALVTGATPKPIRPPEPEPEPERSSFPSAVAAHLHTPPALARDQAILDRLVDALRVCRVVGEDRNAKLVYLAVTSRLLDDQVSLALKGVSSSGKSHTVEAVLRFFPEDATITMTAMSERALIYMTEPFAHRTIVLFEAVALREQREKTESNLTAYFVRSLLSEGRIRYPVTVRDKQTGEFVTKTIVKDGPTNMVLTTTATSLHGENETRMLSLPTNDSADQTRAILAEQAREDGSPDPDLEEWHELQDWLAGAEHRVTIGYAMYLAENIPPVAVRLRRDFGTILALIKTHAVLHQESRDRDEAGRIVASWDDYGVVRDLVADVIADGVGATVSHRTRETVEAVAKLTPEQHPDEPPDGVKVTAIAGLLDLDRSAASRRVKVAREAGYLVNIEDRRGRPGRYVIGDPMPEESDLLPAVHMHTCTAWPPETAGHSGVCRCAAEAERKREPALCAGCGEPMTVYETGQTTHPNC